MVIMNSYRYLDVYRRIQETKAIPIRTVASVELSKIEALTDNWNGEGAIKPLQKAIDNARLLSELLVPFVPNTRKVSFDIFPSTYGTIVIEIQNKTRGLSIEVGKTKIAFFMNGQNELDVDDVHFDNSICKELDNALSLLLRD